MENLVNLGVNSVLSWLDVETKNNTTWTKYINKIENLSLTWNNLNITVTTKRAFKDYVTWFIFFMLRCIVIGFIPLYLISVFWLNFTDSFGGIKDNIKNNITNSSGLWESILGKSEPISNYFWLMDELLEK